MKIDDFKYVKIPFTLYDLFGYLIPGLLYLILFPITHDIKIFQNIIINDLTGNVGLNYPLMIYKINDFIQSSPWLFSFYLLLLAYLLGHLIAALSSFIYERIVIEKFLKYPTANMFKLRKHEGLFEQKVFSVISKIPDGIKCWFFGNYRRPYSKEFIDNFKSLFEDTFGFYPKDQSDIFWLSFSFVNQNSPQSFQRAAHFLNLYGFARNLSMTFLLFAITLLGFELFLCLKIEITIIILFLIISFTFFWQYLKFFRRINDEIFRGFISIKKNKI